jgi:hypothetical protein
MANQNPPMCTCAITRYLVIAHVTCWFNIYRSIFKIAFVLLFFHHYNLLASDPLTLVLAHSTLHKSALLAALLMTALVHCSHILRHVLLLKSAVLAAAPLRCSCDRLWSPSLSFFFLQAEQSECPCQPTLTMTTPAPDAKLLPPSGPWPDSELTPSLASTASTPSRAV